MLLNVIPWENKKHQLLYTIRSISYCTSFGSELNICTVWCRNITASNILSGVQFDVSKGAPNEYQMMLLPNFKTQNMNNF